MFGHFDGQKHLMLFDLTHFKNGVLVFVKKTYVLPASLRDSTQIEFIKLSGGS